MAEFSKLNGYIVKDAVARADLASEITRSINQDNNLQYQINGLASGSPLIASSTSEMTDTTKTYVNTSDGKWYYYDGLNWIVGGTYQATEDSDTLSNLDFKVKTITDEGNYNLFNPFTSKNSYGLSSSTGAETANNNFFISDYIDVTNIDSNTIGTNYPVYKVCFYDSEKTYINVMTGDNNYSPYIFDISPGVAYCRIQMQKSTLIYDDRYKFVCSGKNYIFNQTPYYPVSYNDIQYNSILTSNLSDNIANAIVSESIKLSINPFKSYDFSYGQITTSTGAMVKSKTRILTQRYYIPKKTIISTNNNYYIIIFKFEKDGTYVGRIDNGTTVTVSSSGYYNIVMRKSDETIITENDKTNMASSLIFEYVEENKLSYTGEKIDLESHSFAYEGVNVLCYGQDSCQYNGKIFVFNSSGQFKVIDIETETTYGGFELDQYSTIKPHCNCVCFSNEFYSSNDSYPLLYVNAYNAIDLPKGTCYVHRIIENGNSYTTALIQTINIGFTSDEIWTVAGDTRDYGNFLVDTDNNHLIAYTLRNNQTRFFIFNLPDISESNVTLSINDIIEYFDCEFFNYIQGGHYKDGKVYSLDGIGSSENPIAYLHVFDLNSKSLCTSVDLKNLMYEPESIIEYDGTLWVAQSNFIKLKF